MKRRKLRTKIENGRVSVVRLAEAIGITQSELSKIIHGNRKVIKEEIVDALCKELVCYPDDILAKEDSKVYYKGKTTVTELRKVKNKYDQKRVYVLENEIGRVKVGSSADPKKRIRTFESDGGVKILRSIFSTRCPMANTIEKHIHYELGDYKFSGEWFIIDYKEALSTAIMVIETYNEQYGYNIKWETKEER